MIQVYNNNNVNSSTNIGTGVFWFVQVCVCSLLLLCNLIFSFTDDTVIDYRGEKLNAIYSR